MEWPPAPHLLQEQYPSVGFVCIKVGSQGHSAQKELPSKGACQLCFKLNLPRSPSKKPTVLRFDSKENRSLQMLTVCTDFLLKVEVRT